MTDFTKFTDDQLEKMLEEKREEVAKMIAIPGLQSELAKMEEIKEELNKRKDGETK